MSDETIARLTIKRADEMTHDGREVIAEWLRDQADSLVSNGQRYSKRFVARYHAVPNDGK